MTPQILAKSDLWLYNPLTSSKLNHIPSDFTISYTKWEKIFPSSPSCCYTKYCFRTDPSEKTETDRFIRKSLTMRWRSRKNVQKIACTGTHMYIDFQGCFQQFYVIWDNFTIWVIPLSNVFFLESWRRSHQANDVVQKTTGRIFCFGTIQFNVNLKLLVSVGRVHWRYMCPRPHKLTSFHSTARNGETFVEQFETPPQHSLLPHLSVHLQIAESFLEHV